MYYLGIDLGGTNIVAGVVDEDGNIVVKASCKTSTPRTMEAICDDMAAVAQSALENAGLTTNDVQYIGIGAPGAVNSETGVIEFANNFGFHNWEIVNMMEQRLGTKIYVENDANAAAYGEYCVGAAKDANDAVMITLGTGVGSGIVVDGRLVNGHDGHAGELGHTCAVKNGRDCPCGQKGCLETYCSATGVARTAVEMLAKSKTPSILRKVKDITSKDVFDAAEKAVLPSILLRSPSII